VVVVEWTFLWLRLKGQYGEQKMKQRCSVFGIFFTTLQILYIIFSFFEPVQEGRLQYFGIDSVVVMWLFFFFALGFYIYSRAFRKRLAFAGDERSLVKAHETLRKVNEVSLLCSGFFLLRALLFSFGAFVWNLEIIPLTTFVEDMDYIFYPTFYYTLPDVVSFIALLRIMTPNEGRQSKKQSVHSTLLTGSDQLNSPSSGPLDQSFLSSPKMDPISLEQRSREPSGENNNPNSKSNSFGNSGNTNSFGTGSSSNNGNNNNNNSIFFNGNSMSTNSMSSHN